MGKKLKFETLKFYKRTQAGEILAELTEISMIMRDLKMALR